MCFMAPKPCSRNSRALISLLWKEALSAVHDWQLHVTAPFASTSSCCSVKLTAQSLKMSLTDRHSDAGLRNWGRNGRVWKAAGKLFSNAGSDTYSCIPEPSEDLVSGSRSWRDLHELHRSLQCFPWLCCHAPPAWHSKPAA